MEKFTLKTIPKHERTELIKDIKKKFERELGEIKAKALAENICKYNVITVKQLQHITGLPYQTIITKTKRGDNKLKLVYPFPDLDRGGFKFIEWDNNCEKLIKKSVAAV